MLKSPHYSAFSFFGFEVKYYGLMLFFGMIIGFGAIFFIAKKYYKNVNPEILLDLFPWLIIVSILSARFYYVLLNLDFYTNFKSEILAFRHGGISIHGAILGGLIFGIFYLKFVKKVPFLPYADAVSYGLAIGQSIGRWGNFFNQEAFGLPCNLPWALYIEPFYRPEKYRMFDFFHPTFLYESIWDFFVFLILFFFIRNIAKNKSGLVFFYYLALYSVGRFFIEGIRVDSALNVQNIPIAQIMSILIFIVSLFYIFILNKRYKIT